MDKQIILFDFSRTILFPKNSEYKGGLNTLHNSLKNSSEYNFLDHFYFNEELLEFLEKREESIKAYIFTTGRIQETPEVQQKIGSIFKETFTVGSIGVIKTESRAYELLAEKIGCDPKDILFVDDNLDNINAAEGAGYRTVHFSMNSEGLTKILSSSLN